MKIDNAQLAAFAAVLGEGTFELAARRLCVTPSAISQRIRQLEERLGQVLIQRSTPCQATAAGQLLLAFAEQTAVLEAEVLARLGVTEGNQPAAVRIPVVVNADSLDSWFCRVFDGLPGLAPVTLDIRAEDQDHSALLLRDGTVMAGVSADPSPIQGCSVEALGVMRYLAVASPAYLARHFPGGFAAAGLEAAPMLMFNRKDDLQRRFVALLSATPVKPPTHFAPSTQSFFEAARRGAAWGVMPEHLASAALAGGELVELAPGHWLDVPLYWHCWRIRSEALQAISRLVRQAAREALRPAEGPSL